MSTVVKGCLLPIGIRLQASGYRFFRHQDARGSRATLLHVDELLDILDESGRPTGEVVAKSEAHRLGLWHRCFHCWICGSDPEGSYLLLQRRAATKDTRPLRQGVSRRLPPVRRHISGGPASPEGGGRGCVSA